MLGVVVSFILSGSKRPPLMRVILLIAITTSFIMMNVIMLNVSMLDVIMMNVIIMNVIKMNVIMMNVIILCGVAPFCHVTSFSRFYI